MLFLAKPHPHGGGTLTLKVPIKASGRAGNGDAVTIMLPDGTRHTLPASVLAKDRSRC